MQLSGFEWSLVGFAATLALGVIGYFVKSLVSKPEKHEDAINIIKQTFATKTQVEAHDKEINHIKQTYVTKDEMREMRTELRAEIKQLTATVNEIRDSNLPKEDFYRSHMETNRKLEGLQQLILDQMGGD